MEGKEYLRHGDIANLAKKMNVSQNHMALIIRGKRNNLLLEQAAKALISTRKTDFEKRIESIDADSVER
ncbi:MAG: hypothetical protein ACOVQ4_07220 [Flectobacillus sp.]|uniref:hypothetical protein n=1 Tax=Flectobacillus sp. TaxID=50419 RepID=UPI003B9B363C